MSVYEQLLTMLNEQEHLTYLLKDYPQTLESIKDTNLTLRQMIAILGAVDKDCLQFTQQIERLVNKLQVDQNHNYNSQSEQSILEPEDEYKEILFEIEEKLNTNIQNLSENQLINLKLTNYKDLNYQVSLDILTKFIDQICLNKQAEIIVTKQLEDQMIKQQKKNFTLQIENMKILSNNQGGKKLMGKDRVNLLNLQILKQKFSLIRKQLNTLTKEFSELKKLNEKQYQLIFHQDYLLDKILTDHQFNQSYTQIFINLQQQQKQYNLNGQLKQSLLASQQINNADIQEVFEKLKQKLTKLIYKTQSEIMIKFEEICTHYNINPIYLQQILLQTKNNFQQILKFNQMQIEIINDKNAITNQIRESFQNLLHKMNEENLKLKLLQLTKVLEKTIKKQHSQSLESLKSIHYK